MWCLQYELVVSARNVTKTSTCQLYINSCVSCVWPSSRTLSHCSSALHLTINNTLVAVRISAGPSNNITFLGGDDRIISTTTNLRHYKR